VSQLSRREWSGLAIAVVMLAACRGGATQAPAQGWARMFAADGAELAPPEVVAAMAASDVVLIGEQHAHPRGLGLAADLFETLLAGPAGASAALALESLGRDQQAPLDAFLRGEIGEAAFRKETGLEGERKFPPGHRRMVAAARVKGRPVIAANAAPALVKRARLEGLEPLRALEPEEQALIDVPDELTEGTYREQFVALMGEHAGVDAATLEGFYRAQNVWDATMAGSIARALKAGLGPVVQVVGSFHVDGEGGLVQRVRAAAPQAKVWRLSVVADSAEQLRDEDRGRAEVVAYVGPMPA
jgi:uncharacterized iron-regulated protein